MIDFEIVHTFSRRHGVEVHEGLEFAVRSKLKLENNPATICFIAGLFSNFSLLQTIKSKPLLHYCRLNTLEWIDPYYTQPTIRLCLLKIKSRILSSKHSIREESLTDNSAKPGWIYMRLNSRLGTHSPLPQSLDTFMAKILVFTTF